MACQSAYLLAHGPIRWQKRGGRRARQIKRAANLALMRTNFARSTSRSLESRTTRPPQFPFLFLVNLSVEHSIGRSMIIRAVALTDVMENFAAILEEGR